MKQQDIYFPQLHDTFVYTIGQNAQDNFDIIDAADPDDYWFHVHDAPSAHVIVRIPTDYNKKEKGYIIKKGCELAKQHSSSKSSKKVVCVFCKVRHLAKTSVPGKVELHESVSHYITL